jgi:hypothetical protein
MLRLRYGRQLLGQLQQAASRGFAAEAALAEESAYLRFGSPFAQQLNLSPALAQLAETQVRWVRPDPAHHPPSAHHPTAKCQAGPSLQQARSMRRPSWQMQHLQPCQACPNIWGAASGRAACMSSRQHAAAPAPTGDPAAQRAACGQRGCAALQHGHRGCVDRCRQPLRDRCQQWHRTLSGAHGV